MRILTTNLNLARLLPVAFFCLFAFPSAALKETTLKTESNTSCTLDLPAYKKRLVEYYDSGDYQRDVEAVVDRAVAFLKENASKYKKPAIVLDIDETSLSNRAFMIQTSFGFFPEAWHAWVTRAESLVITPTLELFHVALEIKVSVFFVTAREETFFAATKKNLLRAGYTGWRGLFCKPLPRQGEPRLSNAVFKTQIRKQITEQGYQILFTMGDKDHDLMGGYALQMYKVPNPFY